MKYKVGDIVKIKSNLKRLYGSIAEIDEVKDHYGQAYYRLSNGHVVPEHWLELYGANERIEVILNEEFLLGGE